MNPCRAVCAEFALCVADVSSSFAIPVELNGRTRSPRVAVRSGMSSTSYVMYVNEDDESMIHCQTERILSHHLWRSLCLSFFILFFISFEG